MIENPLIGLDVLIKILLVPLLILAIVLVYRLDRVLSAGVHSAESIERTAENVQKSSETINSLTAVLRKIPFTGSGDQDG